MRVNADYLFDLFDEVYIAQLQRRHIHCYAQGNQARIAPAQTVFDSLAQCPAPNIIDQTGFFQDRDKTARLHQAGARIIPPDQRFGAGDLAARKIYLGLVIKHELSFVECLPQLILQS